MKTLRRFARDVFYYFDARLWMFIGVILASALVATIIIDQHHRQALRDYCSLPGLAVKR